MLNWLSTGMLIVQATLAIIAIEQLRRRVFVHLHRVAQPELMLDVWGPLALVIPMLFAIGRVESNVRGAGWIAVAGPALCAIVAVGLAMIVWREEDFAGRSKDNRRALAACAGAGLFLLLLGAANDLALVAGQCAFAIGAVLVWVNTPGLPQQSADSESNHESAKAAGIGMTLVLGCAVGQGVASMWVVEHDVRISGALMIGYVVGCLAVAVRVIGSARAIRMGAWAAGFGVFLGVGALSLKHMIPQAIEAVDEGYVTRVGRIAFGFGTYAIEAVAMIIISGLGLALGRMELKHGRIVGFAILTGAALLAAWRLSEL